MTGKRFGMVTVTGWSHTGKFGKSYWVCHCDCGTDFVTLGESLNASKSKSCGCVRLRPPGEAAWKFFEGRAKISAKSRDITWNLSSAKFRSIAYQTCHYCGAEPIERKYKEKSNGSIFMNGIDRLDSKSDYSFDNCVPCCTQCNFAKHTRTKTEFLNWIQRVHTHQNS